MSARVARLALPVLLLVVALMSDVTVARADDRIAHASNLNPALEGLVFVRQREVVDQYGWASVVPVFARADEGVESYLGIGKCERFSPGRAAAATAREQTRTAGQVTKKRRVAESGPRRARAAQAFDMTDCSGGASVSPDGLTVAFNWGLSLNLMDRQGNTMRSVLPPPGECDSPHSPAFSPDNRTLVYVDQTCEGATVLKLTDRSAATRSVLIASPDVYPAFPSFSSDGQSVVFTDSYTALRVARVADGQISTVPLPAAFDEIGNPHYSPNDQQIVFEGILTSEAAAHPDVRPGERLKEIFTINADGTGLRRLTTNLSSDSSPTFTPDGDSVAYSRAVLAPCEQSDPDSRYDYYSEIRAIEIDTADDSPLVLGSHKCIDGYPLPLGVYGAAYPQPRNSWDDDAALRDYIPRLAYDETENTPAVSVHTLPETFISFPNPGYRHNELCVQPEGAEHECNTTAIPDPTNPAVEQGIYDLLQLDYLRNGTYPGGRTATDRDYMREDGTDLVKIEDAQRAYGSRWGNKIQGRIVHEGLDTWLQYWVFYYFNGSFLGIGDHEGDWELVQVRLDGHGVPRDATFAAHRDEQQQCTTDQLRLEVAADGHVGPVVYVASNTHASYPQAGTYDRGALPADTARGTLKTDDPALEYQIPEAIPAPSTPSWTAWPGRWGGTPDGNVNPAFQPSPRGPLHQGTRTTSPGTFAAAARPCNDGVGTPTGARTRSAGESPQAAAPAPSRVTASRAGADAATVSVTLPRSAARSRNAHSVAVTITASDDRFPPFTKTYQLVSGDRRVRVRQRLAFGQGPYTVSAAIVGHDGALGAARRTTLR